MRPLQGKKSCEQPWLEEHAPKKLMSELEKIFDAQPGWKLVFTPPYEPKFQPIELVWRHSKNEVASDYFPGRSLAQTHESLLRAWYGGERLRPCSELYRYGGITKAMCGKWIFESERWMDNFIEKESTRLEGKVGFSPSQLVVKDTDNYDIDGDDTFYDEYEEDSCGESLDDGHSRQRGP